MKKNKQFIYTLLWASLILVLSSIPGGSMPSYSWMAMLSFDKFAHAFVYSILVFLFIMELSVKAQKYATSRNIIIFAFLIGTLYGGLIELMQENLFVDRKADLFDFLANMVGGLLGIVFYVNKDNAMRIVRIIIRKEKTIS